MALADDAAAKAAFPFQEAAPRQDWEWDKDERFDELIEQLAINEASLEAVQRAIARRTRGQKGRQSAARSFEANNRMMDRKGGGPMNWREFYGTNAEKFFYHPVDPNTTYRTSTVLKQMGAIEDDKVGSGVPASQSVPVHQRPPQFDYIYRANREAGEQALQDAATMQAEVMQLEVRLAGLEKEQGELWCNLAFRPPRRLDMNRKPLLRFTLVPAGSDPAQIQQANALAAAARFFAAALLIVDKAEEDQATALTSAKTVVVDARYKFDDALLGQTTLAAASQDREQPLGQFVALAKMLSDKSKTLSESYEGATGTESSKDPVRKDRYRGMLQRTVVDYAQILLALNELTDVMQKEWKVGIDVNSAISTGQANWVAPVQRPQMITAMSVPGLPAASTSISPAPAKPNESPSSLQGTVVKLIKSPTRAVAEGWALTRQMRERGSWDRLPGEEPRNPVRDRDGVFTLNGRFGFLHTQTTFEDCDFHVEFKLPPNANSGILLRGWYEVQLVDSGGGSLPPEGQCGAIWGQHPGNQRAYRGANEWNALDGSLRGDTVTLSLNGVSLMSNAKLGEPSKLAIAKGGKLKGPFVLMGDSQKATGVEFQNFMVVPVDPAPAKATTGSLSPQAAGTDLLSSLAKDGDPANGFADPMPPTQGEVALDKHGLTLITPHGKSRTTQIALPVTPSENYRISFKVERLEAGFGINIGLVVGGARVMLVIDGSSKHKSGLEGPDGMSIHDSANPTVYTGSLLTLHQPTQVVCTVVGNSLTVECDGKQIIQWEGSPAGLTVPENFKMPAGVGLSLGGQQRFRFADVQYVPLDA
jgi:hypothetical protein